MCKMLLALMVAAVVLVGTPLLMAGPMLYEIAPVGSSTATQGRAITPDGKYVVGTPGGGTTAGFIWDAVGGSRIIDAGGAQAHDAVGVGYRKYDSQQEIVVFGNSTGGTEGPTYWISSDGGYTFGPKLRRTGTGADYPAANAVAGSSTQADAWYDVWDRSGTTGDLVIEQGSGDPNLPAQGRKGVSTEARLLGVSSTGVAVGWRKGGSANAKRNYVLTWQGPTTPDNFWPNGLRADAGDHENRDGQLWAIAAYSDGTDNRAGGMSPVDGGRDGRWPFVVDDFNGSDFGTATELPTFDPNSTFGTTKGIVYGLSADGRYAVGMDYTLGSELAVLWDLADLDNIVQINLTQFAIDNGIIGDFGNNLRRAYAVGVNDAGEPVVTGWGYDNVEGAVRGYVLQVGILLPGDMNGDGVVNSQDVGPFIDVLLNGPFNPAADMTGDSQVNGLDVDLFVAKVGDAVGAVAIPEPSTISLVAIGGLLGLFAYRWRQRHHATS